MVKTSEILRLRDYDGKYFSMSELKKELGVSGATLKKMFDAQSISWGEIKKQKIKKTCLSCQEAFESKGEWLCKVCGKKNKKLIGDENHLWRS